jgi:hypothetical protein
LRSTLLRVSPGCHRQFVGRALSKPIRSSLRRFSGTSRTSSTQRGQWTSGDRRQETGCPSPENREMAVCSGAPTIAILPVQVEPVRSLRDQELPVRTEGHSFPFRRVYLLISQTCFSSRPRPSRSGKTTDSVMLDLVVRKVARLGRSCHATLWRRGKTLTPRRAWSR